MNGFAVHVQRYSAEVTAPLRLPASAGAALRGALFGALRGQFCLAAGGPECGGAALVASCPVCFLLAPREEGNRRGRDVPRPYALRVDSSAGRAYAIGERLELELATFGQALSHFPYALLGIQEMGRQGLGAGRQGVFQLREVWALDPLGGRQERLFRAGEPTVRAPGLPIGWAAVEQEAARLGAAGGEQRLRLELFSPTRLIAGKRLVKPDDFELAVLMARLLERLGALFEQYGDGEARPEVRDLLTRARAARIVERGLVWRELSRGSGRHGRLVPMGGLVGSVVLEGELGPLLPWLVWGTLVQVGKDASMGNGVLRLGVDL
jgi:hypothetical protein